MALPVCSSEEITCLYCKFLRKCIVFPCAHQFCETCYFSYYNPKIVSLSKVLKYNPQLLHGTCSYIGCPGFCKESQLTISPDWLQFLFKSQNDIENAKVISKLASFLSGIPTYFYKCDLCTTVHISTTEEFECMRTGIYSETQETDGSPSKISEDPVHVLLDKLGILNLFAFELLENKTIFQNQLHLLEIGKEYLVVLGKDKDLLKSNISQNLRIFTLTKDNWRNSKYFGIVRAIVISEDRAWITVSDIESILVTQTFMILQ